MCVCRLATCVCVCLQYRSSPLSVLKRLWSSHVRGFSTKCLCDAQQKHTACTLHECKLSYPFYLAYCHHVLPTHCCVLSLAIPWVPNTAARGHSRQTLKTEILCMKKEFRCLQLFRSRLCLKYWNPPRQNNMVPWLRQTRRTLTLMPHAALMLTLNK